MNAKLWADLQAALSACEADPSCRGLIIRSGLDRDVFTAGNDLAELYAPQTSLDRYREFWVISQRFLANLYRSRLVTAAAIRGACPAGGCVVALCCDVRVITASGTMGLNEVQLGIPVPRYWTELMATTIGQGKAEPLLLEGRLVPAHEAKSLGLVTEVVSRPEELMPRAMELIKPSLMLPPADGRMFTKLSLREDLSARWAAAAKKEAEEAWERTLTSKETIAALEGVMARLAGGKSAGQRSKL